MIRITSSKNPVVKEVRSLRSKSERYGRGLYFIEGARFVAEAVNESGKPGNAQDNGNMLSTGSAPGTGNMLSTGSAPGTGNKRGKCYMTDITGSKPEAGSIADITENKPDAGSMAHIRYVVVSDSFAGGVGYETIIRPCLDRGIRVYSVTDSLFGSVSDTDNPQGVLAVLELKREPLKDAALRDGIVVILDGIRDPGNMGTIIRTADAAGCAAVVVTDGCVDLFNPKVLRSTMGSVFHLPVLHCGSSLEAVDICRRKGFLVCASHIEGSVSIYDADLSGNVALVIGSEAEGVGDEVLNDSDLLIRIPMAGRAESLNAAVAAAVMIYEAVRQKSYR
jgi:TrmH family RNA methyltransferase